MSQSVPPPWCEAAVAPRVHDSGLVALTEASAATSPICSLHKPHADLIQFLHGTGRLGNFLGRSRVEDLAGPGHCPIGFVLGPGSLFGVDSESRSTFSHQQNPEASTEP